MVSNFYLSSKTEVRTYVWKNSTENESVRHNFQIKETSFWEYSPTCLIQNLIKV